APLVEWDSDIEASVARGYFTVNEEAMQGMSAIAAPLFLPNKQVIGCLVAFGTSSQLPAQSMERGGLVLKRAADILSMMSPAVRALEPMLIRSPKPAPVPAPVEVDPAPAVSKKPRIVSRAKAP